MEFLHDMEVDPVQWQSTQKQFFSNVFRDAPAPEAPILPTEFPVRTSGTRTSSSHKRRRLDALQQDDSQNAHDSPLQMIQRLEHGLKAFITPSTNPVRKANKTNRTASAGSITLGSSVGASSSKTVAAMPPPKLKIPNPDVGPSSSNRLATPVSDSDSFNWSKTESPSSTVAVPAPISASTSRSSSTSRSNETTTALPCTPPPRTAHTLSRPTSLPTLNASSLISPEQEPELPPSPPTLPRSTLREPSPPPPPAPVRINTSVFSLRSDSESTTASDATATTVPEDVPLTPPRASLPIIDLTLTPTPSPPLAALKPLPPVPPPAPPQTRAVTAASKASASTSLTRQTRPAPAPAHSEPQPLRPTAKAPPARAQTNPSPSTTAPKPPKPRASQQYPRVFASSQTKLVASSQTRLGLGAMGKGYGAASKPFKIPNRNGVDTPLTISALPPRGRGAGGSGSGGGSGSKGKNKSPTKSDGKLNFAPSPAPPSPTKRKENANVVGKAKGVMGRKTPTPAGRPTGGKGASVSRTAAAASSKARKEPSSDGESYLGSDPSFDSEAVDADMAQYDY